MSEQPQAGQPVHPDDNPQRDNVEEQHGFGIDEHNHGWAPDHGQAGEEDREAGRKAWEAHDTQDAAHGEGDSSPDPDDSRLPSETAGESTTSRGEDITERDGKEAGRQDTGVQGETERPTGTSTARDVTGVDPQDPIDPASPNLR
jgi:hypothetical protein